MPEIFGFETKKWWCGVAAKFDVIVVGAGASGLMCAAEAAKRSRRVLVLEHAAKPGQKLLITGGGRCNFTNRQVDIHNFVSQVPRFCKSALSRFSPNDFIGKLEKRQIKYAERSHGQLFCKGHASDILNMLLDDCRQNGVTIRYGGAIEKIAHSAGADDSIVASGADRFSVVAAGETFVCSSLVIASGGLSLPETGASNFGLKVAEQFMLKVVPVAPGLVPLTLQPTDKEKLGLLAGIAVEAIVSYEKQHFRENVLFTHRGLSGPAILQISSYWRPGREIMINFLPHIDLVARLDKAKQLNPLTRVKTVIGEMLPKRLVEALLPANDAERPLANIGLARLKDIAAAVQNFKIMPAGTEGYRTAEVTRGGIDCSEVSSKTFAAHKVAGLYFIGEILDVTGWLGGYNLQWAWSSGWCAGQYV